MNAQYFIYTRNSNIDYKLVYTPSDDFCTKETRLFFIKQARGCINIEEYEGSLDEPRWLVSIKNGFLLFGIGINNAKLSFENTSDYTGTPVRGFFGFVVKLENSDVFLPFDIDFFKSMYVNYVSSVWKASLEEFKYIGVKVECDNGFNLLKPIKHDIRLNLDSHKSVILGNKCDVKEIIEEILFERKNVSFISNLSEKRHAFEKEYGYMNSIVDGITERVEKIIREVPPPNPPEPSRCKKKLVIGMCILLIILTALIICLKTVLNPAKSEKYPYKGDTIQQVEKKK